MPLAPEIEQQVAQYLRDASSAHLVYRQYLPHKRLHNGRLQIEQGDPFQARAALEKARDARIAAHDIDPDHLALAWGAEAIGHDEMVDFYAAQLAR